MLSIVAIAVLACGSLIAVFSFIDFNASPPPPEQPTSATSTSATDSSPLRAQFMQQLRRYEEDIEPVLAGANLTAWNAEKELSIAVLKDNATAAFAAADYRAAINKLTDSEILAKQVLAQRDTIFSAELALAEQALADDDAIAGKLHITKALVIKPGDQQARDLATRIDALPKVVAWLKKAAVAHTENNPEKEFTAVSEALKLAPHRRELQQRQAALAEKIKEARFAPLIARGLRHVEKRQLGAARKNYQQAKALYSERPELAILNKAISKLAVALDLEHAIAQGKTAIAQDRWKKAQEIYAIAAGKHPDDKTVIEGLQLADKMVGLQNRLANYINQPQRLSSQNVSAAAQDALMQARIFSRNSNMLTRQASELKHLLAAMNIEIPVSVKSDNQTYILVRGVGKVGRTEQRTIRLKPGRYTFEGLRKGYKSKLVEVRIPVGSTAFGVEVICDESI
ncbi:MAG: hypothetical protein R8K53_06335 [Mariprofundaceae bacterium]